MDKGLYETSITSNIEISPGVHVISFEKRHGFISGQVIKIALSYEHLPRIYSICNGTQDNEVNILFNIKEEGYLTPKLSSIPEGGKILVSKPSGSFVAGNESTWMIATGTGIAPFFSMLDSGVIACKKLIHGVSYLNQFYFGTEIRKKLGENYICCCSREQGEGIFHGRVTSYIKGQANLPKHFKYYLCGKALMVVEVRDLLISKGVPYENILAEIYF